ncbi:hypothetical protein NIBR502774_19650 (plasmid) [Rhizobium sp. NIBRBAC000502774]|nr:hypothetical protein NIBR502774_19650 [Rhizobium sp. NIBRBAC000502774]
MSYRLRIQCVQTAVGLDLYEQITHVGGAGSARWKLPVKDVIRQIRDCEHEFFVEQPQRRLVPATFLHLLNEDERQSLGVFAGFRDAMAITGLIKDLLKQGYIVRQERVSDTRCREGLTPESPCESSSDISKGICALTF